MLNPVSSLAESIADLFTDVLIIAAIVFVIVAGMLTYFAIRYRARPQMPDPEPSFGNRAIEQVWIGVPVLIIVGLLVLSVRDADIADPPTHGQPPDLIITGHQWWWDIRYPASGVETANEIHIPTGKKLLVQLEAADVIHDFWVPSIGRKMDAIPGQTNRMWISANKAGTYLGACAEYCGLQHAWMRLRVIAQPPPDFDVWLQGQGGAIAAPAGALANNGQQIFQARTCANCHSVQGTTAPPDVGPNLAHFATRDTIATGVLTNTPANLARWLKNPDAYKPGVLMPNLNLSDDELQALVAYLEGQP